LSELQTGDVVQVFQLADEDLQLNPTIAASKEYQHLPHEIQDLLLQFANVFATQVSYPPPRAWKHTIPLVLGASPFFIRPYRYAPGLKDEIEKQVQDMLSAGLIQSSTSPFSSPVLLAKKKDNTFQFCVDYRQLNAIIAKG
jgi:hypothetical protein